MTLVRLLLAGAITAITCVWTCPPVAAENFADQLEAPIDQSIDTRVRTQERLDQWHRERTGLVARYEELEAAQTALTARLKLLQKSVSDQQAVNLSLQTRIDEAETLAATIQPFLETVYPRLVRMIEADLPFLAVERKERLGHLRETLDNPEVSLSEQYRKTMEMLFIEASYGNNSEVYQEQIRLEDNEQLFFVLRLGRIALFCLSLNQEVAGYYNVAESRWRVLPGHWCRDLRAAIDMAEKRRPTDLVRLPLGRLSGQQ